MNLKRDEYIVEVEARTWQYKKHTRLAMLRIWTNHKQVLECGVDYANGTSPFDRNYYHHANRP